MKRPVSHREARLQIRTIPGTPCGFIVTGMQGAACKHLRALRCVVDDWVTRGLATPFYYPATLEAAQQVRRITPICGVSGVAILHNFLALQKEAGDDTTTSVVDGDDETTADTDPMFGDGDDNDDELRVQTAQPFRIQNLARAAISTQIQQHSEHTANGILLRLHGLCVLLENATLTRTAPLDELERTLRIAQINLEKALPPLPPPELQEVPQAHVRPNNGASVLQQPLPFSPGIRPIIGLRRPAPVLIHPPENTIYIVLGLSNLKSNEKIQSPMFCHYYRPSALKSNLKLADKARN
ncbi:hypothetical protein R3P38DRAFT_3204636 [Favolaschia claudopus]|uniref:Uncharacterized protein n=1 Tax=Favolaschia claudopus TaxID=2862362 RepID=A0AAW0APX4_9AGAR